MGKRMLITRAAQNTRHLEITLINVQEQHGDKTKCCIYVLLVYTKKLQKRS